MVPRSQVGAQCSHSSFLTEMANPHSDIPQSGCGSIMRECSVVTMRVQLHLGPASDECKALFAVSHFFVIWQIGLGHLLFAPSCFFPDFVFFARCVVFSFPFYSFPFLLFPCAVVPQGDPEHSAWVASYLSSCLDPSSFPQRNYPMCRCSGLQNSKKTKTLLQGI